MDWVNTIKWGTEAFWLVALPLIFLTIVGGGLNAITFTTVVGDDRRWISVGPIYTWLIGAITTIILLSNSGLMASLLGRLAQLAGLFESLSLLHATTCMVLVIVTTARAFFVISEMDSGRYAGTDEVPGIIAQSKTPRFLEAFVRLLIVVCLTLFAGSFLQIIIPAALVKLPLFGTPTVFSELKNQCVAIKELLLGQSIGVDMDQCMKEAVFNLPVSGSKQSLEGLSQDMTDPIIFLLIPCYGLMAIWSLIVWQSCKHKVKSKEKLRSALNQQWFITGSSILSAFLIVSWTNVAVNHAILGRELEQGVLKGWLAAMSSVGILVSLGCFLILMDRTIRFDTVSIWNLLQRMKQYSLPIKKLIEERRDS